jgi:DnaJ-class molecular chaperone
MSKCSECGGTGSDWVECCTCDGKGRVTRPPSGIMGTCDVCDGHGCVEPDVNEVTKAREEGRMEERRRVSYQVAQLRHLYSLIVNGHVLDAEEAARGLLAPAIRRFEEEGGK